MRDSRKTLIAVILLAALLIVFSAGMIRLYNNSDYGYENDRGVRDALAGSLDTLFCGASHSQYGVIPDLFDAETGAVSYNLCGTWQSLYGAKLLVQNECERNPVKEVYVAFTHNTLSETRDMDEGMGDMKIIPRLKDFRQRMNYITHAMDRKELPGLYRDLVSGGCRYIGQRFGLADRGQVDASARGYFPGEPLDVSVPAEDIETIHNARMIDNSVREENARWLDELVTYCQERNIRVHLMMLPISSAFLWEYSGYQELSDWLTAYAEGHGCTYWDFNLYRGRYELWNDQESFSDPTHLSRIGAEVFTPLLAQTVKDMSEGLDITDRFYPSYEEMLMDSPYRTE